MGPAQQRSSFKAETAGSAAVCTAPSAPRTVSERVDVYCLALLVGYGLFRALMNATYATGMNTVNTATPPLGSNLSFSIAASAFMLLASGTLAVVGWLKPRARLHLPALASIVALSLTNLASGLGSGQSQAGDATHLVLSIISGVTWIVANAAWLMAFVTLRPRRCLTTLVGAMLLSSVVLIPLCLMPVGAQAICLAVMGLLSAALYWWLARTLTPLELQRAASAKAASSTGPEPGAPDLSRRERALGALHEIWSPLVIYAVLVMTFGLVTAFQTGSTSGSTSHTIAKSLATVLACLIVAGIAFLGRSMPNIRRIFRLSFPLVALALIALPLASTAYSVGFYVALVVLNAITSISVLFLLIEAARMWDIPILSVSCLSMFAARLLLLAGLLAGQALGAQEHLDETVCSLVVSAVALYLLSLPLVSLARPRRRGEDREPGGVTVPLSDVEALVRPRTRRSSAPIDPTHATLTAASPRNTESVAPTPSVPKGPVAWNDLTDREAQIVDLLAHGRSMSHAAQELGLATNTVRNYVQRIYEKLDVHSKQELIELLDAARQQDGSRDQPPLG